jgi:hypothetical protein
MKYAELMRRIEEGDDDAAALANDVGVQVREAVQSAFPAPSPPRQNRGVERARADLERVLDEQARESAAEKRAKARRDNLKVALAVGGLIAGVVGTLASVGAF